MRTVLLSIAVATCLFLPHHGLTGDVRAQGTAPDVKKYVAMVDRGEAEKVRAELPDLLSKYPNNPGVLYIQALVTVDGAEAVRIYQSIVDNFPKSEWAPPALYKVYQFYYALGLYRTAEMKMNQLKKDYPGSSFARSVPDTGVTRPAEEENRAEPAQLDTTAGATQTAAGLQGPGSDFALQVGAYTAQVNAEKQKLFFENLGYPVEVISKVKDNRSLFLVLVGTFPSYDAAKAKGADIKKKYNIDSFVIAR